MERSHARFALALHEQLATVRSGDNLVWSPYSVASALGVVAAGARGRTRAELVEVLAPGADLAEVGRVLAAAARPPDATAAVANTLWMEQHRPFREEYQQAVLGWPGGSVQSVDFAGDPDGSRRKINDDVAYVTHDLIRELLGAGVVTRETVAVVVNALYLKVAWRSPFPRQATKPAPFHAPSGTRQVATMRQQESLRYAAAGGWRMVTLPTASREVVVDVLLAEEPADPDHLPDLDTLLALRAAARPAKVELALPAFRVEAGTVLGDHLRRRGVVAAFDPSAADFSGMTEAGDVFIEQVVHKAVLRVDEEGFEGAAATAVVMRLASLDLGRPVRFHVDRPFSLVVRHHRTGSIYFVGWVSEP